MESGFSFPAWPFTPAVPSERELLARIWSRGRSHAAWHAQHPVQSGAHSSHSTVFLPASSWILNLARHTSNTQPGSLAPLLDSLARRIRAACAPDDDRDASPPPSLPAIHTVPLIVKPSSQKEKLTRSKALELHSSSTSGSNGISAGGRGVVVTGGRLPEFGLDMPKYEWVAMLVVVAADGGEDASEGERETGDSTPTSWEASGGLNSIRIFTNVN